MNAGDKIELLTNSTSLVKSSYAVRKKGWDILEGRCAGILDMLMARQSLITV